MKIARTGSHLVQSGTKTTDESTQDGRTEGEGRIFVVSKVDKIPRDVSPIRNDRFPVNMLQLFIYCILEARKRFIQVTVKRSLLLIVRNVAGW